METKKTTETTEVTEKKPICGIVMPIATMDEIHTTAHWNKVLRILKEAVSEAQFEPKPVWESDGVNIIQKNIVQNLYDNDIVICDVSCNNPNVMFELGLRLAFDKPTIVVADKGSKLSFDTAMIEHVMYPQNLDYYDINSFKDDLIKKLKATVKQSKEEPMYSVFLKHFREIKPSIIESVEGSINDVVLDRLDDMRQQIILLQRKNRPQIISVEDKNRIIKQLIRQGIDYFCKKTETDESIIYLENDDSENRQALFQSLKTNRQLRDLCESPEILKSHIDKELMPF